MPQEIIDIIRYLNQGLDEKERLVMAMKCSDSSNGYEDEHDGDDKEFEENNNMIDSIFEDCDHE